MRTREMRVFCSCMMIIVIILMLGSTAFASLNYDLRDTLTYNQVSGNTNSSFLIPGLVLTQDLGIRANGNTEAGWRYRGNLSLRNVIDFTNKDFGVVKIRNLNLSLTKNPIQLQLGKVYADFGQYTMTQNMTGAVFTNTNMNLSVALGIVKPYMSKKSLMRLALGAIREFELDNPLADISGSDILVINAGIAVIADSSSSLESIAPESNMVASAEVRGQLFSGVDCLIAIAGSAYDDDSSDDVQSITGVAAKAELVYNLPGLRLETILERVSPAFTNLSSPMGSDRIDLYTKARMSMSETLQLDTSYRIYVDNLDNKKPRTTQNQLINLMFNQTWLESRNNVFRYGLKSRLITANDNSVSTRTLTFEAKYKGRLEEWDYAFGASQGWTKNLLKPSANKSQSSLDMDIKGNYYIQDISIKPFAGIKIEQDMPTQGAPDRTYTADLGSNFVIDYDSSINARMRYMLAERPGTTNDFTRITSGITYARELQAGSSLELSAEIINSLYRNAAKNCQEAVVIAAYRMKF